MRDGQRDCGFRPGARRDPRVAVQARERESWRDPCETPFSVAHAPPPEGRMRRHEFHVRDPRLEKVGAEADDVFGGIEIVSGHFLATERERAGCTKRLVIEGFVPDATAASQRGEQGVYELV